MKVLKRIVTVAIFTCIFIPAPISGEITPPSEPVTITVWTESTAPPQSIVTDEWVADFQEEYPWISVEHQGVNNEVWEETLRTGMYSEEPPDIFVTESRGEVVEYVKAGLLYDLTDWYEDRLDRFIPGYELNSVINDRRYAIPWSVHVVDLIWYNTRIMERYNLDPTTIKIWGELMAMCEILKQHGEIPFAFGGGGAGWTGGHWVMLLLQKNLTSEDIMKLATRQKKWTDADVVAALSHFEEIVKQGYLAPDAAKNDRNAGRKLYFQGQGAFWQAGSWHQYQKNTGVAPPDWEFKFIPFPNFKDAPVQNIAISSNVSQWSVHSKSEHIDEALLFLDYITRRIPAAELWVREVQGFIAIRGAVNENTAGPEMIAIAQYLESAEVTANLEFYLPREVVQDGHWKGSIGILSGENTTKEWAELIEELHKAAGVLMLE